MPDPMRELTRAEMIDMIRNSDKFIVVTEDEDGAHSAWFNVSPTEAMYFCCMLGGHVAQKIQEGSDNG